MCYPHNSRTGKALKICHHYSADVIAQVHAERVENMGCSIVSPAHGSMLDLVQTKDLVNAEFKTSCRVQEALCGLSDSIELGGYVDGGRQNKGDYFVTE